MKEKKKIDMGKLIFLVLITTIIVVTLSLSRYKTTYSSDSNTKVANMTMSLNSNILTEKIDPVNNEQTYKFNVSNKSDAISEVAMEYTLQIKSLSNLPLEFELYNSENDEPTGENLLNGTVTDKIQMEVSEEEIIHQYILKIKWREDNTDYRFSKEIDYIQIILDGEQID